MTTDTQILPPKNDECKPGNPAISRILGAIPTLELLEEINERAELQAAFWRDVAALAKVELARLKLAEEGAHE